MRRGAWASLSVPPSKMTMYPGKREVLMGGLLSPAYPRRIDIGYLSLCSLLSLPPTSRYPTGPRATVSSSCSVVRTVHTAVLATGFNILIHLSIY